MLVVSDGFQLVGMVTEADLLALATRSQDAKAFARGTTVAQVMRPVALVLSVHRERSRRRPRTMAQAELAAAPVAGLDGRYVGIDPAA